MAENEAALIARFRSAFSPLEKGVGIGDDAAVIPTTSSTVITTDLFVEGVDFTKEIPARFVGEKSLSANLSDLAAMGATPSYFVISVGIPAAGFDLDGMIAGMVEVARRHQIILVGGDLSMADQLLISITALGSAGDRSLLRSNGKPGHSLYLSRPVGGAQAGFQLLQKGWSIRSDGTVVPPGQAFSFTDREVAASAIRRHVSPEPEVGLGIVLAGIRDVGACIDISDGLSTDLDHLCKSSNCGALIEKDRIPVFEGLGAAARALGIDVASCVLHGGEEYALLFTSTLTESELSSRARRPVYRIGRLTGGPEIVLEDGGKSVVLTPGGFDHFAPGNRL